VIVQDVDTPGSGGDLMWAMWFGTNEAAARNAVENEIFDSWQYYTVTDGNLVVHVYE